MRPCAIALVSLLALCGCNRPRNSAPAGPPVLRSAIDFGDPLAAFQILRGLHEIEANAWRWTSGRFSVRLAPPAQAAVKGARLRLSLTVPEPVIAQLHDATLSCAVNNVPLPPETWNRAGQAVLERDVAPIAGDVAVLECSTAKVIAPGPVDARELGVIVSSVRLEPK
jgi:hypothetical protein